MKILLKYRLALFLLRIISATWKFEIMGSFPQKPSVLAFWHGKMLPAWKFFAGEKPLAIISRSKDGELLSILLEKWNYELIRGSSSKGGRETVREAVIHESRSFIMITPDGPRGPLGKFKAGAVVIAHRRQIPLYLCAIAAKHKFIFGKSWDKFEFPLPFAKIKINFSDAIFLPEHFGREEIDLIIKGSENLLNEMGSLL